MKEIEINGIKIGKDNPCFLIAEIGVNHNGSLERALSMVDLLQEIGVNAVKFQTYITEKLVLNSDKTFEMLKKYELSQKQFSILEKDVVSKGMVFLSTPFDVTSASLISKLVPAFKISSGDLTNFHLLKRVCSFKKPIIISTGASAMIEVSETVNFLKKHGIDDIVILQCTSCYPVSDRRVYLDVIDSYEEEFPDCVIGFSDHSIGNTASLGAVAKGAKVIERHFTLDKNAEGPDHKASLDYLEMFDLVQSVRKLENQLGGSFKIPFPDELSIRENVRKSIVSIKSIKINEIFSEKNISTIRPWIGISAKNYYEVIGKKSRRFIPKNTIIKWDDVN
jgi:N,N'-diacetyllegionaminate synthase